MIGYVVLACFTTAVLGGVSHHPKARIAGSHDVDIQQYPYHVQLHEDLSAYGFDSLYLGCNGAIITAKHVVTTASCISPYDPYNNDAPDVSTMLVKVNSSTIVDQSHHGLDPAYYIHVKKYTLHPYYTKTDAILAYDYNIAVLELSEALQFGPGLQPIGLPNEHEHSAVGGVLSVTGFGAKEYGGEMDYYSQLQALQSVVVPNEKCTGDFIGDVIVTERQLCTGSVLGASDEGSCGGDEGSPAAFEGVLQGLHIFGDCGHQGHGNVYTSVAELVGFVNDVIAASNQA